MIEFLNNLDTSIFLAINGHHSPFFDSFMTLFTGRFIWVPMYIMVAWLLFHKNRWQSGIIYLLCVALAVTLTDQTCATIIRPVVERLRPSNLHNPLHHLVYIVDGYRGGSYGFPSCHAANSFALASFLILFVRRRSFTLFILSWAVINSYSRLYLGVHYPGDLLVGAIIGTFFGILCHNFAHQLILRFPGILPSSTLAEGCRLLSPSIPSLPSSHTSTPSLSATTSPLSLPALSSLSVSTLLIAIFALTLLTITLLSL